MQLVRHSMNPEMDPQAHQEADQTITGPSPPLPYTVIEPSSGDSEDLLLPHSNASPAMSEEWFAASTVGPSTAVDARDEREAPANLPPMPMPLTLPGPESTTSFHSPAALPPAPSRDAPQTLSPAWAAGREPESSLYESPVDESSETRASHPILPHHRPGSGSGSVPSIRSAQDDQGGSQTPRGQTYPLPTFSNHQGRVLPPSSGGRHPAQIAPTPSVDSFFGSPSSGSARSPKKMRDLIRRFDAQRSAAPSGVSGVASPGPSSPAPSPSPHRAGSPRGFQLGSYERQTSALQQHGTITSPDPDSRGRITEPEHGAQGLASITAGPAKSPTSSGTAPSIPKPVLTREETGKAVREARVEVWDPDLGSSGWHPAKATLFSRLLLVSRAGATPESGGASISNSGGRVVLPLQDIMSVASGDVTKVDSPDLAVSRTFTHRYPLTVMMHNGGAMHLAFPEARHRLMFNLDLEYVP